MSNHNKQHNQNRHKKQHKDKPINDLALVSSRSFSVEETERYAGSLGDPARIS